MLSAMYCGVKLPAGICVGAPLPVVIDIFISLMSN